MEMKIVGITVAILVSITVLAGVLMPVLDDATATTDTFENNGYFKMVEMTDDTDVTILWDHTKPTMIKVGDFDYDLSGLPLNKTYSVVGSDKMIIRFVTAGGNNNLVQIYTAQGYMGASVSNGTDMTITISGMTITADNGTNTREVTATQGYIIDPNGVWVMKSADNPAYIHTSDSVMIFSGMTNVPNGGDVGLFGTGTIDDGMNIEYVPTSGTTPTVTFGDVTFNYTDVDGYEELVSLNNCTFDITINGTTGEANYSYFIVPAEVTAERTVHFTNNQNALFAVIPMLVIVAILIGVVALVIRSRLD